MDKRTKKKFVMLAAAGLVVVRGVPMFASQGDVANDIDATLQQTRSEQRLSLQDIDHLAAFDAGEMAVGLY